MPDMVSSLGDRCTDNNAAADKEGLMQYAQSASEFPSNEAGGLYLKAAVVYPAARRCSLFALRVYANGEQ
jgi:hypothetical protein